MELCKTFLMGCLIMFGSLTFPESNFSRPTLPVCEIGQEGYWIPIPFPGQQHRIALFLSRTNVVGDQDNYICWVQPNDVVRVIREKKENL